MNESPFPYGSIVLLVLLSNCTMPIAEMPDPGSAAQPDPTIQLVAGGELVCALRGSGAVWCWQPALQAQSRPVKGIDNAVAIDVRGQAACAVSAKGVVVCWGDWGWPSDHDRWGLFFELDLQAWVVEGLPPMLSVSVGGRHACGVAEDGRTWCWGHNGQAQVGLPATNTSEPPRELSGLDRVEQVVASSSFNCARSETEVACWGSLHRPQMIQLLSENLSAPTRLELWNTSVELLAGGNFICSRDAEQRTSCLYPSPQPVEQSITRLPTLAEGERRFMGGGSICVAARQGELSCSGAPLPALPALSPTTLFTLGSGQVCYDEGSGRLRCWSRELDEYVSGHMWSAAPMEVKSLAGSEDLRLGSGVTCVRMGAEWRCLGDAAQRLDPNQTSSITPEPLPFSDIEELRPSWGSTFAVRRDGSTWCWGRSSEGECGVVEHHTPPVALEHHGLHKLSPGYWDACGLLSPHELYCWGTLFRSSEPQVFTFREEIVSTDAGQSHRCVLLSSGEVYCWGSNEYGQLGLAEEAVAQPTRVEGVSHARGLALGADHSCVLHEDGSVSCWGANANGELGDGSFVDSSSPHRVELEGVQQLVAGVQHTYALLANGRLAFWGMGQKGLSGDGHEGRRGKPVLVPGLDEVVEVAAGGYHVCVRLADGSVWCWGDNAFGQLGFESEKTPYWYELQLPEAKNCGDAALQTGERCDDGNQQAGDGCDERCQPEDGWSCDGACRRLRPGEDCSLPIALLDGESEYSFEGWENRDHGIGKHCPRGVATGGELIFQVELAAGEHIRLRAESAADLVLYASAECPRRFGDCLASVDEAGAGGQEELFLSNPEDAAQRFEVYVDSYTETEERFRLELTREP
ncbi:MAG: hypothetical protein RBU37_26220 [Myxococcota bacterium]|nr:hypothetical protein [Myxococcota bacterium]